MENPPLLLESEDASKIMSEALPAEVRGDFLKSMHLRWVLLVGKSFVQRGMLHRGFSGIEKGEGKKGK